MIKTEINWGIISGQTLLPYSIRSTRKQAIDNFLNFGGYKDKKSMKYFGHNVTKVTITYELPDKNPVVSKTETTRKR